MSSEDATGDNHTQCAKEFGSFFGWSSSSRRAACSPPITAISLISLADFMSSRRRSRLISNEAGGHVTTQASKANDRLTKKAGPTAGGKPASVVMCFFREFESRKRGIIALCPTFRVCAVLNFIVDSGSGTVRTGCASWVLRQLFVCGCPAFIVFFFFCKNSVAHSQCRRLDTSLVRLTISHAVRYTG